MSSNETKAYFLVPKEIDLETAVTISGVYKALGKYTPLQGIIRDYQHIPNKKNVQVYSFVNSKKGCMNLPCQHWHVKYTEPEDREMVRNHFYLLFNKELWENASAMYPEVRMCKDLIPPIVWEVAKAYEVARIPVPPDGIFGKDVAQLMGEVGSLISNSRICEDFLELMLRSSRV
jgi:hypothetical protein